MCRPGCYGSAQDRPVLLPKLYVAPKGGVQGPRWPDFNGLQESVESVELRRCREVTPGFAHCVLGRHQGRVGKGPKALNPSVPAIGGREQHVGVEKEPIHRSRIPGAAMGNGVGVETKRSNLRDCEGVVFGID